jgi:hypothetical protein
MPRAVRERSTAQKTLARASARELKIIAKKIPALLRANNIEAKPVAFQNIAHHL